MNRFIPPVFIICFLLFNASALEAGEYLNTHLPKWVELDLELRHRYEWRSDFDFNEAVDDEKGFHLWRTRLNLMLKPKEDIKLFYQFQDSRISHDSISGSKADFENWAETRQAWVEVKTDKFAVDRIGLSKTGVRVGRQELSYGAERLLGAFNWSNVAQTFDAGKVMLEFREKNLKIDIFAGGKTPNKSPESDDFYDGSANDRLGGYYATFNGENGLVVDQYVMNRNTDGKTVSFGQTGDGEVDDYTIGGRLKGKWPNTPIDLELEAAKQVGNSGSLDVDAQMVVALLGYTFDHSWQPRLSFEFDYASGDNDSSDGERETFDNLYPTNHLYYGFMDFVSLQNINIYRFQWQAKPMKKLDIESDYHLIYLDTPKDNLYSAGRTIKRATRAGADSYVGSEIDLLAKYKVCNYANLLLGYSHFFAGNFLKDTGSADDADFFYVQTSLNF